MKFLFIQLCSIWIVAFYLQGTSSAPHRNRQSKPLSNEVRTEPLKCNIHEIGMKCNFAELKQIKECQKTGVIDVYKCKKTIISENEEQSFTFFRFHENFNNTDPFNLSYLFVLNVILLSALSYWGLSIYKKNLEDLRVEKIYNKHQ